jgi:hypothetical protein
MKRFQTLLTILGSWCRCEVFFPRGVSREQQGGFVLCEREKKLDDTKKTQNTHKQEDLLFITFLQGNAPSEFSPNGPLSINN